MTLKVAWFCVFVAMVTSSAATTTRGVVIVSREEQARIILEKEISCRTQMIKEMFPNNSSGEGCGWTWDGAMCWPPTPNGTLVSQPCPDYVNGFSTAGNATRRCTENGTWWFNPEVNDTWTNFSVCTSPVYKAENFQIPELIAAHIGRLRLMYNIGYSLSLLSLVLAVFIMLYFKRLHCPRNMIHINLFASFILRCTIYVVKENALVSGVGFPSDVSVTDEGTVTFLDNGLHWECKLFFTLFNYILCANYMWIFAEGLYLHLLITMPMFSEKSGTKRLIVFGWGAPILFLTPWVVVRALLEDILCWNTHPTHGYFWIIRGPICLTMLINFIIFINIIRVLFTKLNAFKTPDAKRYRYRKLAKSTLVLIPLFGVHLIVFLALPDDVDEKTELVKLYYEMFFNSFQGFMVSLLFCFLNGEVQAEIKKKWRRYMLKREGSGFNRKLTRETMTSFVSRARGSIISSCNCGDKEFMNGNSPFLVDEKHCLTSGNSVSSEQNQSQSSNGHLPMTLQVELQPMAQTSIKVTCQDDQESQPILTVCNNNEPVMKFT